MNIENNILNLRRQLPPHCKLIAVSKTQPIEKIQKAYDAGQRVFGENKVQELVPKFEALPKDIEWHMIGHLQTNKVKYIAPFVHLIHSVDSLKLLHEIHRQGVKAGRMIPCLLQVHIAQEETKFGFSEEELLEIIETQLATLTHSKVMGLMGMASFTESEQQVRKEFRTLKSLFDRLKGRALPAGAEMKELSMGMSGDYPVAVDEGSTMIRVGTAIFGERNYQNK